mmetsp:Transcript_5917/g.9619  ORF Transcript_5917/g.9619 Transcript_5917/m.9619 type:complete len:132 (+) Transcript_5917:336-731(+)
MTKWGCLLALCLFEAITVAVLQTPSPDSADKPLICFTCTTAGNRGVQLSVYDYMYYTENLLGYPTLLLLPSTVLEERQRHPKGSVLTKFTDNFKVAIYTLDTDEETTAIPELSDAALANKCQVCLMQIATS